MRTIINTAGFLVITFGCFSLGYLFGCYESSKRIPTIREFQTLIGTEADGKLGKLTECAWRDYWQEQNPGKCMY